MMLTAIAVLVQLEKPDPCTARSVSPSLMRARMMMAWRRMADKHDDHADGSERLSSTSAAGRNAAFRHW